MSVADKAGYETAKYVTEVTLPALHALATDLLNQLRNLTKELANGAVITITITIPEKKL